MKRVIVCVDQEVAMDLSIESAMRQIYDKLKKDDSPLFQNLDVSLSSEEGSPATSTGEMSE